MEPDRTVIGWKAYYSDNSVVESTTAGVAAWTLLATTGLVMLDLYETWTWRIGSGDFAALSSDTHYRRRLQAEWYGRPSTAGQIDSSLYVELQDPDPLGTIRAGYLDHTWKQGTSITDALMDEIRLSAQQN